MAVLFQHFGFYRQLSGPYSHSDPSSFFSANPIFSIPRVFSPSNPSPRPRTFISLSSSPNPQSENPNPEIRRRGRPKKKAKEVQADTPSNSHKNDEVFVPKMPRRGRRSEAMEVEDFVRNSLQKTFASIKEQNSGRLDEVKGIFKEKRDEKTEQAEIVEEEDDEWPLDTDVGWGIRASDYFDKYQIKNVVGEDGEKIDWEGEMEDSWVKEINCLEWESFAFHPSPLIVLVFERYNRAADNWKVLKELEKAFLVYWKSKDKLPPRAILAGVYNSLGRNLACPQGKAK
ncbi:uncharacterized protein LOC18448686 isoform X2 [Amborella trichopoda]|uniref:uncharacterized protein LOC18448686 isoform X2 n=1 Tax=Amborella trichopoda TaxID=13333 RepID=UPI0009C179E6|nr:uncharacterized protein LOC18448686 isoform X2 [Amborella trichopoda]|eukprot:XP_020531906.1 uncharacterized protein LOC18448686 isoform X2 [Amborella trichopoda]